MKTFEIPKPKNVQFFSAKKEPKTNWHRTKTAEYSRLHSSARWQKLREIQLNEFPLCYFCDHPAVEVHRIDAKDMDKFFDRSNHASLCDSCHDKINQAYKRGISPEILFNKKETNL